MATVHYTAKVKDSRLLELPEEAQELGLKPGEEVTVSVERNGGKETATFPPNEGMLEALREQEEETSSRYRADLTPEERIRMLDKLAERNKNIPALPAHAFDRESLYANDEELR